MLPSLFRDREVVICENQDALIYNSLQFRHVVFLGARDKGQALWRAHSNGLRCLLDRDYLTPEELRLFEELFPKSRFLRYYSIENYLYHPENLRNYRDGRGEPFEDLPCRPSWRRRAT